VELVAAGFEVRAPRFLVASLGALKDCGGALQVAFTVVGIKP
jgi:hypothetical protein